jgi:hypothetical protein
MKRIKCSDTRYIKLGGGNWADVSLDKGELHFGYRNIPHELGLALNGEGIKKFCMAERPDARRAAEITRQVMDFYKLGADCLWITFARGHLWWTFAAPEVKWLGVAENNQRGERIRKSIGGWKNVDVNGKPLTIPSLGTKLTRVMNYRRTICAVGASDYLLRRINGIEEPVIAAANKARQALIDATSAAIRSLHWADFETLVDIVFARSGWHRTSAVGGKQRTIDLELEQSTTGERVAVQVKSQAHQRTLNDYISRIDEMGTYDRLFFVCHSPRGEIAAPERSDVHVWTGREFAATVLRVGLHDWVLEKIA